ncbi:hypothetical protein CPC08DRAFT_758611 [Agrocybe pediades]|nr:hypothetical protein CPC08DRAFT_758611 [Agrocybe pediades]
MSTTTFRVVNRSPARKVNPPSRSSSTSEDQHADTASTYSFVSSSENTLLDHKHSLEDYISGYKSGNELSYQKPPHTSSGFTDIEKHKRFKSDTSSCHLPASSSSTSTDVNSQTKTALLSAVLGADALPYTTEIDSIPCAGLRIPNGPLKGLLAWRLVVRLPPSQGEKRGWWTSSKAPASNTEQIRRYSNTPFSAEESPGNRPKMPTAINSTNSLPLRPDIQERNRPISTHLETQLYQSSIQKSIHGSPPSSHNAVITNFILDTSLPYSVISRDTLIALGYPLHRFTSPAHGEDDSNPNSFITLSIQNVVTKLRVANPDEVSRLGIQFLQDAGVSLFFPRGGDPVFYLESARLFHDVPKTVLIVPKVSLQQRIRALFGITGPA